MSDRYSSKSKTATDIPVEVAMAVIYQNERLLMQLRDDIPGILYPGCWGLFGGHLEPGETPEAGLKREVEEEISYTIVAPLKLGCYNDEKVIRHIYYAPLSVPVEALSLQEGWDLGLVSIPDIQRGICYSEKAGTEKPLGDIHQKILLDFIAKKPEYFSQFKAI
ncbi:MAG: NUDIX domain-containing protein [Xenococcaceae cyanobacterium]